MRASEFAWKASLGLLVLFLVLDVGYSLARGPQQARESGDGWSLTFEEGPLVVGGRYDDAEPAEPPPPAIQHNWSVDMPTALFPNIKLNKTWGVTITLSNLDDIVNVALGPDDMMVQQLSATHLAASGDIELYGYFIWDAEDAPPDTELPGGWSAGAKAAWQAWYAAYVDGHIEGSGPPLFVSYGLAVGFVYSVTASANTQGPGGPTDTAYFATGYYFPNTVERPDEWHWGGPSTFVFRAEFALNNVVARGGITAETYPYRQSPRTFRDLSGGAYWVGTDQTTVTATVSGSAIDTVSATNDLDWGEDDEVVIAGAAGQLNMAMQYNSLPETATNYGTFSELTCSDDEIEVPLTEFIDYSTDGTNWTRTGTGATSQAFSDGSAYTLHNIGGAGSAVHNAATHIVGPIRYDIIAKRYGPESNFEYEVEPLFNVNMLRHITADTHEPIYIPANEVSPWYTKVDLITPAGVADQTGLPHWPGWETWIRAVPEWYENPDNHENVFAEGSIGGVDEIAMDDADGRILFPPVTVESFSAARTEYKFPAMTLTKPDTLNVDIPPGEATRPTVFTGSSVNPALCTQWWPVTDADLTVSRELTHRKWLRLNKLAAQSADEDYTIPDAPIITKANAFMESDDPAWAAAVPVEDVTDWDSYRFLRLTFSRVPTASHGQPLLMRIDYSTITVSDPCYTCYGHRYGTDGEFEYQRQAHQFEFIAEFDGNSVIIDLAQLPRSQTINLQRVDGYTITLPVTGLYELDTMELIEGYEEPRHAIVPAIDPWRWINDWVGFAALNDGLPVLNLVYGFEQFRGEMWGLLSTQYRQHCPESILTDDLSFAKVLSRLVNEINYREGWTATYLSDDIDEAFGADGDDRLHDFPRWWDIVREQGEYAPPETIDCALRIGTWNGLNNLPFHPITIRGEYYTGGVASGILRDADAQIVTSTGGSSYDAEAYSVKLWRSYDEGVSWEAAGSCDADDMGRYVTPPAPVHNVTYAVGATPLTATPVGAFVNRQIAWHDAELAQRLPLQPAMVMAYDGTTWLAVGDGKGNILVYNMSSPAVGWELRGRAFDDRKHHYPTIAAFGDSKIRVWATRTDTGAVDMAESSDGGETWTA